MWTLNKTGTNELIYKTDPQTWKTNLWFPKGKDGRGGVNEFRINMYIAVYTKQNHQGPTTEHKELYEIFFNNL